jgi:hypothetical protein
MGEKMPTGYTTDIKNGITFPQFAMNCARAFGALVTMREEPNAEIPEEFTPSSYHLNKLLEYEDELKNLHKVDAERLAREEYIKEKEDNQFYEESKHDLKRKYEDMMRQVIIWVPPTSDHVELKKFMIEQINSSMSFDCGDYPRKEVRLLTEKEWLKKKKAQLLHDIAYHAKEYGEECERTEKRNKWIRQLRESL